jgi:hypothetical protein
MAAVTPNLIYVSGQVPIASTSMPPAVPFVNGGKVRPIAVMSLSRSRALPDVPTVAELGYEDFEANTWFALFAPARTPPEVLDLLNAEINKALGARLVQERFETLSPEASPMNDPRCAAASRAKSPSGGDWSGRSASRSNDSSTSPRRPARCNGPRRRGISRRARSG